MYVPASYPRPRRDQPGYPNVAFEGMVTIGNSVREARRRAVLSQRQLAQLCGLDQSVISRLENGKLPNLRWWRFAGLVAVLGRAWDPTTWRDLG